MIMKVETDKCVGCEACTKVCPVNAIKMIDGCAQIDSDICIGCGACAAECSFEAISEDEF